MNHIEKVPRKVALRVLGFVLALLATGCMKSEMIEVTPTLTSTPKPTVTERPASPATATSIPLPTETSDIVIEPPPEIPEGLDTRWVEMGYLKDLRNGGEFENVSMVINWEAREFLGWRIGFTEILVDKEFVDMDADFVHGGHKFKGETIILNPNKEGALKEIEKLGAWTHAINLGILDRVETDYDPSWYSEYLKLVSENPNITYDLEGNLPVPGKKGSYKKEIIGTVNASLPLRFVLLPPRLEKTFAMDRIDKIVGGHPAAPFGLEFAERSSGYYGVEVDSQGVLTILRSQFITKGRFMNSKTSSPVFNLLGMARMSSDKYYYRSPSLSFGPSGSDSIYMIMLSSYYSKTEEGRGYQYLSWGYP